MRIIDSTNEKTFVSKNYIELVSLRVVHSLMLPALMVVAVRIHKSLGRVAGFTPITCRLVQLMLIHSANCAVAAAFLTLFSYFTSVLVIVELLHLLSVDIVWSAFGGASDDCFSGVVQQELGRQISCPIEVNIVAILIAVVRWPWLLYCALQTNAFRAPRSDKSSNRSYCIPSFGNAFLYGNVTYE